MTEESGAGDPATPDPDSPSFRSDVQRIADALGLQRDRLAQLIRETDVLKAVGDAGPVADHEPGRRFLLAAREPEITEPASEKADDHHDSDE